MYAAVGFLAAWLMALMCFPAVHHRAQRLLRKEYEQEPLSLKEMQAEKDQIRAGFAAATRDLELSIDKLRGKTAAHATDIAKKVQLIERLKHELDATSQALTESLEREREARGGLREVQRELAIKDGALDAAEQAVVAIKTEIARLAPMLQMPPALIAATQAPSRAAEVVPLSSSDALRQQPSGDDSITRAWTEIDAAARRVEQRYDGTASKKPMSNQNLRAIYAPTMKPAN